MKDIITIKRLIVDVDLLIYLVKNLKSYCEVQNNENLYSRNRTI